LSGIGIHTHDALRGRRALTLAAAVVAAILISLLPTGPVASAADPAAASRTAVVGIDVEPSCLNPLLDDCNFIWSHSIAGTALAGAFQVLPDFSFEPVLVDRVDVQAQPFALTYHIKQQAVWSDGTPVSADDFIFTLEAIRNPAHRTSKAGYEFVTQADRVDAKTVTLHFSQSYPNWKTLFGFVLPKHVLAGRDLNLVWRDEIADPVTHTPIGSGPFLVTSWTRGQSLTVSRNPRWWGPSGPFLDTVEFRGPLSQTQQLDGIRDGSLDLIFPAIQQGVADLDRLDGIAAHFAPGTSMEHLDFNVQSATMPLLREPWFRQAIAFSIDRAAVAAASYDTLLPNYPALHNLSFSSLQPEYEPVFARYRYDPQAVATLMLGHGCIRGADEIWSCAGVRASVKFATTTGNEQRELVQQQMLAQARSAGIELVVDNSSPVVLFGTRLPARQYELIMFTWVLGGGLPDVRGLYGCDSVNNDMGYCSQAVTELGLRIEAEVDPVVRAQLINDANRIMAEDVPSIPLFLKLTLLVQRETLHGPQVNPNGHATWNAATWRLTNDVTAPQTGATASPLANANGWNNGPVTVALAATDDDSGVKEISYSLSGAQTGGAVILGSQATVTVSAHGITTLTYFATDASGNVEPVNTLTIRIDKARPALACAAVPARIWPPTGQLVRVRIVLAFADSLSGTDGFKLVLASSDEPGAGDIQGFDVGTPDTSGFVRAERSVHGDGRVYTFKYEGADRAGNIATCSAQVEVPRRR
jgi:peptide/nickel transport system substrate-binding protein